MKRKRRHTSIQSNLHHYTTTLKIHLQKKMLTILKTVDLQPVKSIVILGDSVFKHLNGQQLPKKVNSHCKIFVKHFPGETTSCMEDYVKPSLRKDLNHKIFHAGTNDFILDRTLQGIATSIANLACSIKDVKYDVNKSNIILRTENKKTGWKQRA